MSTKPTYPTDTPVPPGAELGDSPQGRFLARYRWLAFVLPFAVYMLCTELEPDRPAAEQEKPLAAADAPTADLAEPELAEPGGLLPTIEYRHYPLVYTVKIAATLAAMALVWPVYRWPRPRATWWAIPLGALGTAVWVGLTKLEIEQRVLPAIGLEGVLGAGTRSAFNPLEELAAQPLAAYGFLAIRFVGLAAVVPVIEEFFLRGFVMRFASDSEWWKLPLGSVRLAGVLLATALAVLMHPAEMVAMLVWFSGVTWLMFRTGNIWDCVAVHAVTNLLLGAYVLASGDWYLM